MPSAEVTLAKVSKTPNTSPPHVLRPWARSLDALRRALDMTLPLSFFPPSLFTTSLKL
ncbi:unnamed protein product [Pararhodospirillum photometricum DSM 122]|uniref:Uncharacterized protein n=1 Tax=Pararhodospirillum photometricum DSM 122 TaxID=1150469 RepID=H6SNP7_PARPM|nr:unnamed protein product [Pararhodospirillum photometricum DSM 122]